MWVLLALLTAAGTAVRDAASKHATRTLDPIVVGCGISAVPAVLLGAWVVGRAALEYGLPGAAGGGPALAAMGSGGAAAAASVAGSDLIAALTPGPGFLTALAVSGGINAVTTPLIVWALKRSDLSLMAPLTSVTPLFMIPVAAVVLGEAPSVAGGIGVAVIVVGAYLLNVSDRAAGPLAPLAALARDPGARAMLLVAFLYAISGTYDKVGTRASSPLFWAAAVQGTIAVVLAPLAVVRGRRSREARGQSLESRGQSLESRGQSLESRGQSLEGGDQSLESRGLSLEAGEQGLGGGRYGLGAGGAVVLAGVVTAVAAAAQMTAITLTLVAYVIAVKRTSTLFSVLLGHSLFREEGVAERLVGAAVMLAGFVLVTLG